MQVSKIHHVLRRNITDLGFRYFSIFVKDFTGFPFLKNIVECLFDINLDDSQTKEASRRHNIKSAQIKLTVRIVAHFFLQLGVLQEVNGYMLIYAYLVPLEAMNFEAGHDNPLPKQ